MRGRRQRSADAVGRLVDTLPASPRFGEKWPGHRPDAARYAEGNPTTETTGGPPRFRASPAAGRSARSTPTAVPRVRPPAVGRRPPPRAAAGRGRCPEFVGRPPVYHGGHPPFQDVIAGVVAVVGADPAGNGYRVRLIDARTGRRLGRSASSTVSVLNEPPLGGRSRASGFHSGIDRDRVFAAIFIADEPKRPDRHLQEAWALRPVEGSAERVTLWVQVLTGMEPDEAGQPRPLSADEVADRQRRLDALGGDPLPK